ncbi:MAG: PEGA domain-containing protein [Butyrivibrio sp.]
MIKKYGYFILILALCGIMLCACSFDGNTKKNKSDSTKETQTDATKHRTVSMIGVLLNVDEENRVISFISIDDNEEYICTYGTGAMFYNKSGSVTSVSSMSEGLVADVEFDSESNTISKMQVSDDDKVWENSKVSSFHVNETEHSMRIGKSLYYYDKYTAVFSEGEQISIMELNSQDQLIVRGYDNKIVSIVVDKGHGYITLSGESLFVGGLIDIGGTVVKVIEEDMMIIVKEGFYKVEARNGSYYSEKYVTVTRDMKSNVDFSDVEVIVTETGSVLFNVTPSDAIVYLDGKEIDCSKILTLNTGRHKISVTADGYNEYTDTITVETGYQVISIDLKKSSVQSETSGNNETGSENETDTPTETVVSTVNKVTVSGPEGGFVYFDGSYKGTAPVTFSMITGDHVITVLYNNEIKSYSVTLAEGGDDVTYDFTDK